MQTEQRAKGKKRKKRKWVENLRRHCYLYARKWRNREGITIDSNSGGNGIWRVVESGAFIAKKPKRVRVMQDTTQYGGAIAVW